MLALRFAPFAHGCPQGDYLNEGDFETVILESINTDEKGKKDRYLINQEAISNYKSAIGADFRTYDNTPEHKEYLSRFSSRYSVYFIHIAKNGDTEGCENLSLELSKPEDDDAGCLNAVMHNKKKGYTYFGRLIAPTGLDWAFISFAQIQNTQRCDQGWMAFLFEKKMLQSTMVESAL